MKSVLTDDLVILFFYLQWKNIKPIPELLVVTFFILMEVNQYDFLFSFRVSNQRREYKRFRKDIPMSWKKLIK